MYICSRRKERLTPTFYQFSESVIEVKIAITMARSTEFKVEAGGKLGWGPFSASVDASYSRKYDYKAEGSSLLRTTLVPLPPPKQLKDYMEAFIRARLEENKDKLSPPASQPSSP